MDLPPAHQGLSPVATQICLHALLVKSVGRVAIEPLTAPTQLAAMVAQINVEYDSQDWIADTRDY